MNVNNNQQSNDSLGWKKSYVFKKRLKYIPPQFHYVAKYRWEKKRKLFEMRKDLFNSVRKKRVSSGGVDARSKNLLWKPPLNQPDLLNPAVKKLIEQYSQNIQEWERERNK